MSTNTALDEIKAQVEGHTEGPWQLSYLEEGISEIESTGGSHVGLADGKAADAELMAAAPRLLAALEAVEALLAEKYKLWAAVCRETCVKDHHGVDHEAIADNIATNIRTAIQDALS